jgi:predicted ATPase
VQPRYSAAAAVIIQGERKPLPLSAGLEEPACSESRSIEPSRCFPARHIGFARNRLLDAVSRSGGAERIFRRNKTGALGKSVYFSIIGDGPYRRHIRKEEEFNVFYEYSAEIQLRETSGSLTYARQTLKLAYDKPSGEWPMEVEAITDENENVKIRFSSSTLKHLQDQYAPQKRAGDATELKGAIEELIRRSCANTPLYHVLDRYLKGAGLLVGDLFGAQSFNISPSAVRRPEDIASQPVIEEDGRGLAAVLFALTRT